MFWYDNVRQIYLDKKAGKKSNAEFEKNWKRNII